MIAKLSSCRKHHSWPCTSGAGRFAMVSLLSLASIFGGCKKKEDQAAPPMPDHDTTSLVLPQVYTAPNGSFQIPHDRYLYYRELNKTSGHSPQITEEYCKLRLTPDEPIIREIAGVVTRGLEKPEDKANRLLEWVRGAIEYDFVEKKSGGDYHRYPVETLQEKRGDGEDAAYLYASLCLAAGVQTVLLKYEKHIACAVEGNFQGTYFFRNGRSLFTAFPSPDPEFGPPDALKVGMTPPAYSTARAALYMSHLDGIFWEKQSQGQIVYFFIPHQNYAYYSNYSINRRPGPNEEKCQLAYLTPGDPTIKAMAERLTNGISDPLQKAAALRRFVQDNITYKSDEETTGRKEYHRFPVETLTEHQGDCEDHAYLLLSLCMAAGLDGCLLRFGDPGASEGHMAIGLHCETNGTSWESGKRKYYFVESTGDREIGDAWNYKESKAWVYTASKGT